MSDFNSLNVKGPLNVGADQMVFEQTFGASADNITISGLDGDTNLEYFIRYRFVHRNAATSINVRYNNDAGSSGGQLLYGQNTSIAAIRSTGTSFNLAYGDAANISSGQAVLLSKAGHTRIAHIMRGQRQSGTTTNTMDLMGLSWPDTSTVVTSLTIFADTSTGIDAGSYVALYVRRGVRA